MRLPISQPKNTRIVGNPQVGFGGEVAGPTSECTVIQVLPGKFRTSTSRS